MPEIKIKKAADNITKKHKYDIIDDYIYSSLTNAKIAEKYNTTIQNVELVISRFYKAFVNVRETKSLIVTTGSTGATWKYEILDPSSVNDRFKEMLSEPDSLVLTDPEMIFCELYNYHGDDIKAIEGSKLNVGLRKSREDRDREEYNQSCTLRAFFLKRKPNIASYITKIQKDKLQSLKDGKGFVQAELLSVIEKVRNSHDDRSINTHLKALSELGRTLAIFTDNIKVENIDADSAINKILQKAKEARGIIIEQQEDEGIGSAA